MNENLNPSNDNYSPEELDLEKKLRPLTFNDFTGQDQVLENLLIFVQAANLRGEALDHTLFHGPPGLGKTTLAHILANELDVNIKVTSGPVLDKPGITNLLPDPREKEIKKKLIKKDFNYGIRDDGLIALSRLNNKELLYTKFKNNFKNLIEYYLSKEFKETVEFISVKKQLDISNIELKKEKLKTISMDIYVEGDYQLETSRIFNLSSEQLSPIKLVERPNNININKQINKIPKGSYCLIEDDIVSGNTIKKIKELFKDKIKIEKYFILANLLNKKYDDIIDIRDFLIGSNESGLVVTLNNKNIRVPYLLPYVSLNTRASIPLSYQLEFSYNFWVLIKDFYININEDMKLKDLNKDFIYLMNYIGFKNNDKIKDICDWHINKLEIYKDMYKND